MIDSAQRHSSSGLSIARSIEYERELMASNFIVEKDGPLTTITFSRPERRNCLNQEVILEFERHLQVVRDDRECRVLIVTGQGAAFCAGADTALFKDATGDPVDRRA